MALREIVHYPHEALTRPTEPVTDFGPELQQLVADMAETMYANHGLGLAANQVAVSRRVVVIDLGPEEQEDGTVRPGKLHVFVNPEIVRREGKITWEEGCLSFPGLNVPIHRAAAATVRAFDEHGQPFELAGEGLLAVAFQHELDHLDGITMIDRLGRIGRKLALRRYERLLLDPEAGDEPGED